MQQRGFHLVAKYLAFFSWLAVILSSIYVAMFYGTFSTRAFSTIQDEAMADAEAIAEVVDFSGFENIQDPSDVALPEYQRIFNELYLAERLHPKLTYVYAMRPVSDTEWAFVVDASIAEDEDENGVIDIGEAPAQPGDLYDVTCCPQLVLGLEGPSADEEVATDIWGSWISGYAPIYNEAGEAVGIVGVDVAADEYVSSLERLRNLIIQTLAITILLVLTFGFMGFILVQRDARKIQRALEIRNEELNRQVKKRTASLELMMSAIVHELRAPLTALKWGMQTFEDLEGCSKDQKELIGDLSGQTDGMLELIGRLLDVSRMSLGKYEIRKRVGSIGRTVKTAVSTFTPLAQSKKLELHVTVAAGVPRMRFDASRITEVMNNLLSNAIKYTKKGEIHVTVRMNAKRVLVEVMDTGIGMDARTTQQIFEPFVRGKNHKEIGTGLGLSIAKGIVEAHRGTIGVESEKGQGSTFWFELPV